MVAAAVVGGAVIGGAVSAKGAKDAAGKAADASQAGINFQRESRDLALAYQKPARDAGYQALAALMDMAGLSRPPPTPPVDPNAPEQAGGLQDYRLPGTFPFSGQMPGTLPFSGRIGMALESYARKAAANAPKADVPNLGDFGEYDWMASNPGYEFRREEGQRATENLLRSAGMLNSGKALRAITRYGQDYASNEFSNAWGRLSQIAGFGESAISGGNQIIGNAANAVQQGYTNIGIAQAGGQLGQANAWTGAITDAATIFGDWYGNKKQPNAPA